MVNRDGRMAVCTVGCSQCQEANVLTRKTGYLTVRDRDDEDIPLAAYELQREGFTLLPQVFSPSEVRALANEISAVFDDVAPDIRSTRVADGHFEPFRYEMLNRSALAQRAIGHPAILSVIEPLLGEDCHVIANTACGVVRLRRLAPSPAQSRGRPRPVLPPSALRAPRPCQRLRTTDRANHLSEEAIERSTSPRERTLIGLHKPGFYDG